MTLTDDALLFLIDGYTRESGVRQLEREIGSVCRRVAKKVATGEVESATVDKDNMEEYLGARKHFSEVAERTEVPGVATGLAYTAVGGDILFIEASVSRGTGRMSLTGQLGDVMKESAQAALSYVKAHADELGIPQDAFRHWDLHVHVPAGAIPKDGPSAGVALLSALVSIFTQRRVKHTVAMTGEITLRGLVLPIGGVKEKVLAAKRAGIETVLLPEKNEKDVKEITDDALEGLDIEYVERMESVIDHALEAEPVLDPADFFAVPDAEKHPPASDGQTATVQETVVTG
jgi:ATP-dependent Lon protease